MKTHVANHSKATDFMCEECGKKFSRDDKVGKHGHTMHNVLSKQDRTDVAMASVVTDKEAMYLALELLTQKEKSRNKSRQFRGVTKETKHILRPA